LKYHHSRRFLWEASSWGRVTDNGCTVGVGVAVEVAVGGRVAVGVAVAAEPQAAAAIISKVTPIRGSRARKICIYVLVGYLKALRLWGSGPQRLGSSHSCRSLRAGAPSVVNLVAVPGDQ